MRSFKFLEIFLLLTFYMFISILLEKLFKNAFTLIINPLFLILISIYLYKHTNNNHGRFYKNNEQMLKMFYITVMYLVIYFYLGFLFGFLKSPYSHNFLTILKNIWVLIVPIISIEYIRSALISHNKNKMFIFLITLVLIFLEVNIGSFMSVVDSKQKAFEYTSSIVVPIISMNILYSYLSYIGSYKLVLVYRLTYEIYILLLPLFPDLNWFAKGIVGLVTPSLIYMVFKLSFDKRKNDNINRRKKQTSNVGFFVTVVFVLSLGAFMLGIFKYEPVAIISNSMVPVFYRGDAVVLRKIDKNILKKLKKGDIIVYRIDNQQIVHRIINVREEEGETVYQTMGDANDFPDPKLVHQKQIVGLYKMSIKGIGYPSVWLNEFFKEEKAKVETK